MITVRKYQYLLRRVDYPGGYRMEPYQLPDWIYVTITTNDHGDSKWLTVYSRIHINKEVRVGPEYSTEISDRDMLKDLSAAVYNRFVR